MFNETTDYLRAENFNRSIEIALRGNFNKEEAIMRVTRRLAACPEGVLYIRKSDKGVSFYTLDDEGRQKYLRKDSELLYGLARRKYLELLLRNLQEVNFRSGTRSKKQEALLVKLQNLIERYDAGNLDLAEIVLTSAQCHWYRSRFFQKRNNTTYENDGLEISRQRTSSGELVRSKSERDIGEALEHYAIPYHYEERLQIDVTELVNGLQKHLAEKGQLDGPLFHYNGYICVWNVPKEFEWMNAPGSLWKTYDDRTGSVTIYVDFNYKFAAGDIGVWEHEGLCTQPRYRMNASERIFVIRSLGVVKAENMLFTFEDDVNERTKLYEIVERDILPRVWF